MNTKPSLVLWLLVFLVSAAASALEAAPSAETPQATEPATEDSREPEAASEEASSPETGAQALPATEKPPTAPKKPRPQPLPEPVPAAAVTSEEAGAGPMNEVALELGWNAPAGPGVRYLRRIEETNFAVGLGAAPLTLWGPKLSVLVRRAPNFERGSFQQASVGLSLGDGDYRTQVSLPGGEATAFLRKTPGRTLELLYGYRWKVAQFSLDAFAGWSFNLQGTFLQNTDLSLQPLSEELLDELEIQKPGGVLVGASLGWRF